MLSTTVDGVVHDLGRLAGVADQQVVGTTTRRMTWPPSPSTMEISAGPSARQVQDHSIALGYDRRWFSLAGPRDTFNVAAQIPLSVRIVDHQILAITERDPATNLTCRMLVTTTRRTVRAAEDYVAALRARSTPLQPSWRNSAIAPTHRQLRILRLMAHDLTDERIATQVGLSERQIRSEVKKLYHLFNVTSRFSLGIAYDSWQTGT